MFNFSKYFHEYICHIFVCVYVGVVDYSKFIQILTVQIAHVNMYNLSFYNFCGESDESTMSVTVDWQWGTVFLCTMNILSKLE
jgi:hypothetical protein